MRRIHLCAAIAACLLTAAACSKQADTSPPVAAPAVTLSSDAAAIGSPVDVTYKFTIPGGAPAITDDYTVFVHFVDRDGELLWTDDHTPTPPTRQWKPGTTVDYTRTIFVPKAQYVGEAHVDLGLYLPKTGARLPLAGQDVGMRSYRVATLTVKPQAENTFVVFKEGWHNTEIGDPRSGIEWQWSRKAATLTFRNPKRAATFFLQCDQPVAGLPAQHVDVTIGSATVDSFDLMPGRRELRRIALMPEQMGSADTLDLKLTVDRTFVPSSLPQLKSSDSRELGIRVFRAYLEPK